MVGTRGGGWGGCVVFGVGDGCAGLGRLPPHVAGQEQRVGILPLVGVLVQVPRGGGEAEVGDRLAGRRVTQLRIVDKIADEGDLSVSCCHRVLPVTRVISGRARCRACAHLCSGRMIFVRRTASFRLSWRSSSLTVSGSAIRSMTV